RGLVMRHWFCIRQLARALKCGPISPFGTESSPFDVGHVRLALPLNLVIRNGTNQIVWKSVFGTFFVIPGSAYPCAPGLPAQPIHSSRQPPCVSRQRSRQRAVRLVEKPFADGRS